MNKDLLHIFQCIKCKNSLHLISGYLRCGKCRRLYSSENDIPRLVSEETRIRKEKFVESFYNDFPYDIDPTDAFSVNNQPKGELPQNWFKSALKAKLAADIGCGVGRDIKILHKLGGNVIGVDQSLASLLKIKKDNSKIPLVNASNLNLPFKDGSFDYVLSQGVIHHTGNTKKAFDELLRVVKPRGKLYLVVYRKYGIYYFIYMTLGFWARFIYFYLPKGKVLTKRGIIPVFHLIERLLTGKKRTLSQSGSLYADWLLQPIATFHTYSEVASWCKTKAVAYKQFPKNHPDMVSVIISR